jgi:hypothetical protein
MADIGCPIRKETARQLGVKASQGQGTLLLYPDRLAHVHSPAIGWGSRVGLAVLAVPGFAVPPHAGPGALGALIGAGGGSLIGAAIARSRAARKAATPGPGVTVVPLDSITSLQARQSKGITGRLGGQSLLVTTADGTAHRFSVKVDSWSVDLARALMARGHDVRAVPHGMTVTAATPGLLETDAADGTVLGLPAGSLAGEPASGVPAEPARPAGRPGAVVYPAAQQEPPREPRRMGLIIGIAAVLLALAGIGVGIALHGPGAGSVSLPGRLLGLPRYTGPGAWIDDARLARQLAADSHGNLVRVTAVLYRNRSGSGPGILVAEGALCATCAVEPASQAGTGILAHSPVGAHNFPPGRGGGALVCFSHSAQGQTAFACTWLASKAKTGGVVIFAGGAASGLADAAAKTRQILAAIQH